MRRNSQAIDNNAAFFTKKGCSHRESPRLVSPSPPQPNAGHIFLVTDYYCKSYRFRDFHWLAIATNMANALNMNMNDIICGRIEQGGRDQQNAEASPPMLDFMHSIYFSRNIEENEIFKPPPPQQSWPPEMKRAYNMPDSIAFFIAMHSGTASNWGTPKFCADNVTDEELKKHYIDCRVNAKHWGVAIFEPQHLLKVADTIGYLLGSAADFSTKKVGKHGISVTLPSKKEGRRKAFKCEINVVVETELCAWCWCVFSNQSD